ncbi:hypothetical protein BC831DRAFT_465323 [Entophlyctis helioformis]|nr:hypothetical protein BC831DRAFT_465323 [Entophlyctis helioformis]
MNAKKQQQVLMTQLGQQLQTLRSLKSIVAAQKGSLRQEEEVLQRLLLSLEAAQSPYRRPHGLQQHQEQLQQLQHVQDVHRPWAEVTGSRGMSAVADIGNPPLGTGDFDVNVGNVAIQGANCGIDMGMGMDMGMDMDLGMGLEMGLGIGAGSLGDEEGPNYGDLDSLSFPTPFASTFPPSIDVSHGWTHDPGADVDVLFAMDVAEPVQQQPPQPSQ